MTAQSLKARVAKRLKAVGQPKRRRADRYSKPFRSKPKPEGYVFGRPTLYRPEYCQRAIEFMGQGYSVAEWVSFLPTSFSYVLSPWSMSRNVPCAPSKRILFAGLQRFVQEDRRCCRRTARAFSRLRDTRR